jgi:hypothetical protein
MINSGCCIFDPVLVLGAILLVGEQGEFDRDLACITDAELERTVGGDLLMRRVDLDRACGQG